MNTSIALNRNSKYYFPESSTHCTDWELPACIEQLGVVGRLLVDQDICSEIGKEKKKKKNEKPTVRFIEGHTCIGSLGNYAI